MAFTTSIKPSFAFREIIVVVICVAFTAWGAYDYWVKIPAQEEQFRRAEIYRGMKAALELDPFDASQKNEFSEKSTHVLGLIKAANEALIEKGADVAGIKKNIEDMTDEERAAGLKQASIGDDESHLKRLVSFVMVLQDRTRGVIQAEFARKVDEVVESGVDAYAEAAQPRKFDRLVCWAFMACILWAPIPLFKFLKAKSRVYKLDDDGTLTAPEGVMTKDEITDIDMSKWMSKSIATVLAGERSIKLDDYLNKDMHLIVGAIAHGFYPEEWTIEAKIIRPDEEDEGDDEASSEFEDATDEGHESGDEAAPESEIESNEKAQA